MELSRVTKTFTESVIREMTRVSRQHPGTINLAQGFPDFAAPDELKKAAVDAINADINQYAITWGCKNLREAIAAKVQDYNKMSWVEPDKNITVTCGATEAMMSSLKAIINPGDEVVIFEPFYENYGPDCRLSDSTPKYVTLNDPDWSFDEEEIKETFSDKTKAIIINTPNNPTGKVFDMDEMKLIRDLCVDYDAIAVTDEIYEHILYDEKQHISIASLDGMEDRSITVNSASKTYSVTGWRVGWAIADSRITQEIKKVHDFLTVGAPAPLQEAVSVALKMDTSYYDWLADFYTKARDTLYNTLKASPLEPIKPYGAYYIICNANEYMASKKLTTSMELAMHLIEEIGVATVPGSSFYRELGYGEHQTRFCFSKKPQTLDKAVERIKKLD